MRALSDLWLSLPAVVQDLAILLLLLLPALAVGALVLRGLAPGRIVAAMMWRFRWVSLMFVILIAVSVGTGVGILAQERGLRVGSAAAADKFDLIISAPGSEMTMMLAAVYLQPSDVPLLGGEIYNEVANHENVTVAAPLAFGDSYGGAPVVGTTEDFVRYLSDNRISGRMFTSAFESVIGAAVPLEMGERFVAAHGIGDTADYDAHAGAGELEVVGRMGWTGTPWDRSILVPVEQVWEVHGLANGHAPGEGDRIGPPFDADYFPGTPAIIVHADELWANYALRSEFTRDAETMAFFPGAVLSRLHGVMGNIRQAMSLMSLVTQGLVAISILVGLMMLARLFQRQLALLRAIGAPARFVFAVVWSYATALLAVGAVLGLGFGSIASAILSRVLTARTDILVTAPLGWSELHLVAGFLSLASLLALLPAAAVLSRSIVKALRA
ncbi:MAG: ABC transporter permease [Pseudomonadota bacterium]